MVVVTETAAASDASAPTPPAQEGTTDVDSDDRECLEFDRFLNDAAVCFADEDARVVESVSVLDPEVGNVLSRQTIENPGKRSRNVMSSESKIDSIFRSVDLIYATKSLNVPINKVHFLPKGLTLSVDDMACVYSQLGGLQLENERGLVLRADVDDPNHRGYNSHFEADKHAKDRFNGVKGRPTTLIGNDGSLGSVFLQYPG